MGSLANAAELAGIMAVGTVFGGTIIRFLVHKWLKDREDFERTALARFEALAVEVRGQKDYSDRGDRAIRDEWLASRDAMVKGAEHEFKILRDRWHALDTLTQVLVNNIGLMREEIKNITEAQGQTTEALHDIDKTLSRMAAK